MSRNFNDLSKQVFGKLTVIEKVNNISKRKTSNHVYWKCLCKCGKEVIVRGASLTSGNTKSCGCIKKDYAQIRNKRFNNYDFSKNYCIGYTSKNEIFIFDKEDYEIVSKYCWRKKPDGYFDARDINNRNKRIMLHNVIMKQKFIDHKNGLLFDNRKENLRTTNNLPYSFKTYNQMNKSIQKNNKSGVVGVYKKGDKWVASISINKQQKHLGTFTNFEEAVIVRKDAERQYFGDWSYENSRLEREG